jgi:uncharacterized peroxidase-related enzyme
LRAHAYDLRDEGAPDELAEHAMHDYRQADLDPRVRALCDYAVKLTAEPASVGKGDADLLRSHGWSDEAIHDAIQVISYFEDLSRVAEAVGIEDEPEWGDARPR